MCEAYQMVWWLSWPWINLWCPSIVCVEVLNPDIHSSIPGCGPVRSKLRNHYWRQRCRQKA